MEARNALAPVGVPAAALLLAASACAAPATSPLDDPDTVSIRVPLADLNLNNDPGARAALRRMQAAAATVCGAEPSPGELQRALLFRRCVDATVGAGVASLGNPYVTALNEQQRAYPPVLAANP
jgi:UrcA family protein